MPAAAFLKMNRYLQKHLSHPTAGIWHRPGGPTEGVALTIFFNTTSTEVAADSFTVQTGNPKATVFVADVLAVDPSRAGRETRLFRNDQDTLTVDGVTYRIDACLPDGYGKVELELRSAT